MIFLSYSQKPNPNHLFIRLKSAIFSVSAAKEGWDNPDMEKSRIPVLFPDLPTPHRSSLDFSAWDCSTLGSSVQYFPFSPAAPETAQSNAGLTHTGQVASPQGKAPGFLSFTAFKNSRRHLPVGTQKVVGVNELVPLINDTEGENTSQCHLKICSSKHPFQLGRQVRYYHPKLISPKKVKKVYQEIKYIKTNLENPNIG